MIRLTAKYAGYTVSLSDLLSEFEPHLQLGNVASHDINGANKGLDARAEIEKSALFSLDAKLREIELQYIDAAIAIAQGNMSQAARVLGVSRSTLYSRLDALRPGGNRIE